MHRHADIFRVRGVHNLELINSAQRHADVCSIRGIALL
jgi:hypothetical protein